MGQTAQKIQTLGDESHPNKYSEIIEGLKSNKFKNITFITGAGISTSAGIPDFRSKGGLFSQTQKKYNLSSPEQFFQINLFYNHPEYFYDFCKGFNIDDCKPTKTHLFQGFLSEKGILNRIFTQNIDGLELKAGCPKSKVTFAHGTITQASCPECLTIYDLNELKSNIEQGKIMYCKYDNKPIKPSVVFYGESLPQSFFDAFSDIKKADLTFIMGTGLKVFPFNRLPHEVSKDSWRVLVNMERVGGAWFTTNWFGFDVDTKKDLFLEGYTDDIVMKIIQDCGWDDEFKTYCGKFV